MSESTSERNPEQARSESDARVEGSESQEVTPTPTQSTTSPASPDSSSGPSASPPAPAPTPGAIPTDPSQLDPARLTTLTDEEKERVPAQLQEDREEGPLETRVIDALATVFDPEIPVNIWELGLIYILDVDEETGVVGVKMTLTSPACPVAGSLPPEVEQKIAQVDGVTGVQVQMVWDPTWGPKMLSDAARLTLGMM